LKKYDVIIIGGGPAGLFSAINIKNKKILLLEKNDIVGRKLLMAGAGRCNITHSGKTNDFFEHYGKNYKFLKYALNEFKNSDLISFLESHNLETIEDKNGKIFPKTEKSKDIQSLLLKLCLANNVTINYKETVISAKKEKDSFFLETKKGSYKCKYLIIATGGKSYPTSGSSGDGYKMAKNLGHTITQCKPALAPVLIENYIFSEIAGVSLKNKIINLYHNNKKIGEHKGDIGFTHTGLSGPGILDFSRYFSDGDLLKINLTNEKYDSLRETFINEAKKNGKSSISTFLKKYPIPKSLIKIILENSNINPTLQLANIDKKNRNKIILHLCEYPVIIKKVGDFNIAMATTGGINLNEISPKKMESKITKNLFFAGEVMDIDGDTGGYNIQAAFSTSFLVSREINR